MAAIGQPAFGLAVRRCWVHATRAAPRPILAGQRRARREGHRADARRDQIRQVVEPRRCLAEALVASVAVPPHRVGGVDRAIGPRGGEPAHRVGEERARRCCPRDSPPWTRWPRRPPRPARGSPSGGSPDHAPRRARAVSRSPARSAASTPPAASARRRTANAGLRASASSRTPGHPSRRAAARPRAPSTRRPPSRRPRRPRHPRRSGPARASPPSRARAPARPRGANAGAAPCHEVERHREHDGRRPARGRGRGPASPDGNPLPDRPAHRPGQAAAGRRARDRDTERAGHARSRRRPRRR